MTGHFRPENGEDERVGRILDLTADCRVEVGGHGTADSGNADDVLEDLWIVVVVKV